METIIIVVRKYNCTISLHCYVFAESPPDWNPTMNMQLTQLTTPDI